MSYGVLQVGRKQRERQKEREMKHQWQDELCFFFLFQEIATLQNETSQKGKILQSLVSEQLESFFRGKENHLG